MTEIKIGDTLVGEGHPCYIVAEIGINHNGILELAQKLIDAALDAGCNAVKFQKRTIKAVYSEEELARPRENPFGKTNGDLKRGLEFGRGSYTRINDYCKTKKITWFSSCWDEQSVDFIEWFNPPCYKLASASLTDKSLLEYTRSKGKPIILSTGMSTIEQIDYAVDVLGKEDLIILHALSTYPSSYNELNLRVINTLRDRYQVPIGYSGHETGLATSIAAVAMGACMLERHITMDRSMWGSDQAASVEPQGFVHLIRDIRLVESAMGDGVKRIYDSELPIQSKLRRI